MPQATRDSSTSRIEMTEFTFDIASPPDREKLVAEIFFGHEQVAELNQETGRLSIDLYPRLDGQPWSLEAEGFLSIVEKARASLWGEIPVRGQSHAA